MKPQSLKRKASALALGTLLVGSLLGGVGAAPAVANHGPVDCAEILPLAAVQKGMQATGYTVWRGRTPTAFNVEVLGILRDAIGPGRHMIIVETSGDIIEQAGGIWYGMSGSPVYFEDKLIGAVAFGLSFGPSSIGGLTPAEDMANILQYPREGQEGSPRANLGPNSVPLPSSMSRTIAAETGSSEEEVGDDLVRLKLPVSVSGLSDHAMEKVQKVIAREELPFIAYQGSSSSSVEQTTPADLQPGGNFAAAISYGDITFAGIGTTTYTCNDVALGFGHPFFFYPSGSTTLGAADADALVIVDDPTFGPYKLATVEERAGMLDQDRFAGVRAIMGELPPTIPITSDVTALDLNRSRQGRTESLNTDYTPFLAFIHVIANIDMVFDQISEGSSEMSWTITGTRENGATWELSRSNMYASEYDISFETVFEMLGELYTLYYNDFEDIKFTGVDVDASVREEVLAYKVTDVHVSKDGLNYNDTRRVRARPGQTIYLKVYLTPHDGSSDRLVDLEIAIPDRARTDGLIEIQSAGGYRRYYCFIFSRRCANQTGQKIESLDDLLAALENKGKNNELIAELRMGSQGRVKASDLEVLDHVVQGRKRVRVRIIGGGGGGAAAVKSGHH